MKTKYRVWCSGYFESYQQAEKRDREYENLLQEKYGIKAHAQTNVHEHL